MVFLSGVAEWMLKNQSKGCFFHDAVAAYPKSEVIRDITQAHKTKVLEAFADLCSGRTRANTLFLLHEGLVQSWSTLEGESYATTSRLLDTILKQ